MSLRRYTGGTHCTGELGTRKAPVAAANCRGVAPGGVGAAGMCARIQANAVFGGEVEVRLGFLASTSRFSRRKGHLRVLPPKKRLQGFLEDPRVFSRTSLR